MPRYRTILTFSLLALLALSCGGHEPALQPAADSSATPQMAAVSQKQPQTLEEKYPGIK